MAEDGCYEEGVKDQKRGANRKRKRKERKRKKEDPEAQRMQEEALRIHEKKRREKEAAREKKKTEEKEQKEAARKWANGVKKWLKTYMSKKEAKKRVKEEENREEEEKKRREEAAKKRKKKKREFRELEAARQQWNDYQEMLQTVMSEELPSESESSWEGSGEAQYDEDLETLTHLEEAVAPHGLTDVAVVEHEDLGIFVHDMQEVFADAAPRKRKTAQEDRKYPGCGASADVSVETELEKIIDNWGRNTTMENDLPQSLQLDPVVVTIPEAAVLGSKDPSAKEWQNSLQAAGRFWEVHGEIFNASKEEGYYHICDRLQGIGLVFCEKLVANGRRNAIEFLNEQGLLIKVKMEKVVVITVEGTEEVLAVLVPEIFSPMELEQITLLTALLFKAKLVAGRPTHCRGEQLYSPGLSTANCNPLKEGRHLRLFVTDLELTILRRVTRLLEVGWKRLEGLVERLDLVCDLSEQREIAKRAWENYGQICDHLNTTPVLPLETRLILKHYLSVNRFTSTHLDNRDRGYAFQLYFGSTHETGSFCLPSLALW
jgi:hypothetical protein